MRIFKKSLKVILIILGIIIGICLLMIPSDLNNQKEIRNMSIKEVDLSKLDDGSYMGEFKKYRWEYNAKVNIKDHKIINISFIGNPYTSNSYSDKLINKVIEEQKINIDTVSGATINDKAILKAIEDAID